MRKPEKFYPEVDLTRTSRNQKGITGNTGTVLAADERQMNANFLQRVEVWVRWLLKLPHLLRQRVQLKLIHGGQALQPLPHGRATDIAGVCQ